MFENRYSPNSNSGWGVHVTPTARCKFNAMDEVAITSDTLNLGLPVGHKGYILMVDETPSAFDYMVRIPGTRENWPAPECDLLSWEKYLDNEIQVAIREHRINAALDAGDVEQFKELTRSTTNGMLGAEGRD